MSDGKHVIENFATGADEVRCPDTSMSTWRYCPYCGENIENCEIKKCDEECAWCDDGELEETEAGNLECENCSAVYIG